MSLRLRIRPFFDLCLGLLIGLCLFEIFLRLFNPLRTPTVQGHKIILPKHRIYVYHNTALRGVDSQIIDTKNALGFRGPNPPADFEKWLTLVAVGGSTTECFYLSDGHDWPNLVGAKLQPAFDQLWVNNAGLDGHSTFGHRLLVEEYLTDLKPKVALFLIGANDIGRDDFNPHDKQILRESRIGKSAVMLAREIQNRSRTVGLIQFLYRILLAKRHGLMHGSLDLRRLPNLKEPGSRFDELRKKHEHLYLPGFENRLVALLKLCGMAHIEPILLTQPALFGEGMDDQTGVDLKNIQADARTNGRMAWRLLELYNDRTRQIAKREGVFLIDVAAQMPKSSRYFYDFYHLTNAGADKVAGIVANQLKPYLEIHYSQFAKSNARL